MYSFIYSFRVTATTEFRAQTWQDSALEWLVKWKNKIMFIHSWWKRQNSWMQEGTIRNMMVKTAIFQCVLLLLSHLSCVQLCVPMYNSPAGSPIPGILQARTLEWVAISFSNAWKWKWSSSVVSDSSQPHGL